MSTAFDSPTQPAAVPPARPWGRIGIIAIVAALAVAIGLAAASFLTARAATMGSGSAYVPADAAMYFELRLEPSAAQDGALRELLGRFPPMDGVDLDRPLGDQLAEMLDEGLAEGGLDLSWSEDVEPWTDGRAAVALLDLPDAAMDPMADPATMTDAPPMLVMLGVTDATAARDTVERLIAEADGPTFTQTEHRGVTIHAAEDEDGAYAITDDQLIAAASADDIVAGLDVAAGGDTLAERDEIEALAATLPADWLAFGAFDMGGAMAMALDAAGTESAAGAAAIAELMEHQPTLGVFSVTATDDGLSFDGAGPPPTGPFAVENSERGLAAEVPGDALFYSEGGNLGAALAAWIGAVSEAAADDPEAAEGIATAEAALGADLEELLAWIDDGALVVGWPDGGEPYAGIVLVPSDRDEAERRMNQLATFAGLAALDPSMGVTVEEAEVAGVTVTTLRWSDPSTEMAPMGVSGLSLQYAVTDDRVLVGIGEAFVGRALELGAADSLATAPRYADAVAALGGADAAGISWLDLAGTIDAAMAAVAGFGVDVDASELEGWLAPFDRLVAVSRLDDEVLVQRSVLLLR